MVVSQFLLRCHAAQTVKSLEAVARHTSALSVDLAQTFKTLISGIKTAMRRSLERRESAQRTRVAVVKRARFGDSRTPLSIERAQIALVSQELLRRYEAQNDVKALDAAAKRARVLGLGDEADAAVQRTRSRVKEAGSALAGAAAGGGLEAFERGREWAISAGVAPSEVGSLIFLLRLKEGSSLTFLYQD